VAVHIYLLYLTLAADFFICCTHVFHIHSSDVNGMVKVFFIYLQQQNSCFLFGILFSCQVNIIKLFSFCYSGNFYKLCSGKKKKTNHQVSGYKKTYCTINNNCSNEFVIRWMQGI
uniref:Uncharacterized protein n=1 Tax=Prolemur simus TaxID=1328070 RepID=A0A8C8Z5Q0_PROSS